MKDQITPIDVGKGIPIVAAACALILGMAVSIVYTAWKSKRYEIQTVVLAIFLYIIVILAFRFSETKKELPVPIFKGWEKHKADVNQVYEEFQEFLKNRLPGEKASIHRFKLGSHESNRTVETNYKKTSFPIHTGLLDQVIAFDKDKQLLHVEPGLSMDELAAIARAYDVIPQVVPEFPGITVGGAIGGLAGESTGHKYGVFHNTVEEMDILTGDGVLHTSVSRTKESDLFMAVCGSYGTQGVLVRAAIRVVPAPKYVRAVYYHEESVAKALDTLEKLANGSSPPEFLDAVALAPSSVIIIAGYPSEMIPQGGNKLSLRNSRFDPWFFWYLTHLAKEHPSTGTIVKTDFLELDDYLFRFDKGAFWMARYPMSVLFGESLLTNIDAVSRGIWSWHGTTRRMYSYLHAPGDIQMAESYMIQDILVPTKEASLSLVQFNVENLQIWPLWICPIRLIENYHAEEIGFGMPLGRKAGDLLFNIGLYGPVQGGKAMDPVKINKALESKVFQLNGKKWLYAQSFYTKDEFWSNFRKDKYDELRERYHNSEVFHDITTKVLLSETTKQQICESCELNIVRYLHKLVPHFCQTALELLTPRIVQPFFGIHHTTPRSYKKIE